MVKILEVDMFFCLELAMNQLAKIRTTIVIP